MERMLERFDAVLNGYHKVEGNNPDCPFTLEVALGVRDEGEDPEGDDDRIIVVGLNHTVTLGDPLPLLPSELSMARLDTWDPAVVLLHVACPSLTFSEHGKGRLSMSLEMRAALHAAVEQATKAWTKAKEHADKQGRLRKRELERLRKTIDKKPDMKASCWRHMAEAYAHVSDGGRLPVNARQLMYAIRPHVMRECQQFYSHSATFTQKILPEYLEAHPDETAGWDVVYDDRGQALEPHTGRRVGLGTLAVRGYIERWRDPILNPRVTLNARVSTFGPRGRFAAALFLEKEGFNALLDRAKIAERYDLLILSTKGMSVTACRTLVEALSEQGIPILVARDLDKAGFSIVETLRSDTRRYRYKVAPEVHDLGLRLEDARAMNLESELVTYKQEVNPADRLRECGAAEEEISLLVHKEKISGCFIKGWMGSRIELNAMTSTQFLDWLEAKLHAHGVKKMLPDAKALAEAYGFARRLKEMQKACDSIAAKPMRVRAPKDLAKKVTARLEQKPELSWDQIIAELA